MLRVQHPAPPDCNGRRGIVIVAIGRSGTNHFCQTLRNFRHLRSMHEIFHEKKTYGLERYRELVTLFDPAYDDTEESSQKLVEMFAADPTGSVHKINEYSLEKPGRYFSFKVFPEHLDEKQLEEIHRNFIRSAVIIVRPRLDVYISQHKALETQLWIKQDTTNFKIKIDVEKFLSWAAYRDNWYCSQHRLLREIGITPHVFSYEDHINVSQRQLLRKIQSDLRKDGMQLKNKNLFPISVYKKQDRSASVFDKITNGEAVRQQLVEMDKLDYALTAPGDFK